VNLLAFDNINEYREVLHDDSFVKIGYKKWPTVGNKTMKKHAYTEWQPDARYVILLNAYKSKNERDCQWVKSFRGERLCVVDGGDKARYWKPFIDTAHIYLKENSYIPTDRKNVRIGSFCPSMKVPFLIQKHKIEWQDERKLRVIFCGDMHQNRYNLLRYWKMTCNKNNWTHKFGNEHTYGRGKYLEMMSKTMMCPSFKGYGARCRREIEVMLCGGLLVQDERLKEYPFVIFQPEKHFTFKAEWNEDIARAGYELARKCFMQAPSVDIRMAALYTFFDVPQIWTYEQLEELERKYDL